MRSIKLPAMMHINKYTWLLIYHFLSVYSFIGYISIVYLCSVPVNIGYHSRSGMRITVSETMLQSQKIYILKKGSITVFDRFVKKTYHSSYYKSIHYIRTAITVRSVEVSAEVFIISRVTTRVSQKIYK
jgi:hypothetical protein